MRTEQQTWEEHQMNKDGSRGASGLTGSRAQKVRQAGRGCTSLLAMALHRSVDYSCRTRTAAYHPITCLRLCLRLCHAPVRRLHSRASCICRWRCETCWVPTSPSMIASGDCVCACACPPAVASRSCSLWTRVHLCLCLCLCLCLEGAASRSCSLWTRACSCVSRLVFGVAADVYVCTCVCVCVCT